MPMILRTSQNGQPLKASVQVIGLGIQQHQIHQMPQL